MTFKPIPDYPNYEINEEGVVRNINTQCVLKGYVSSNGYPRVCLSHSGVVTPLLIHHLIMYTFVGERPINQVIRHLDGNPLNNCLSNLTYSTQADNNEDRKLHGTWGSKLDERKVRIIRGLAKCGFTHKRLTEIFNVGYTHIARVIKRETWVHI